MNYSKTMFHLFDIQNDWQKLIFLSKQPDTWTLCNHIQKIETKYFGYMLCYKLSYPKPNSLPQSVHWCEDFLNILYQAHLFCCIKQI